MIEDKIDDLETEMMRILDDLPSASEQQERIAQELRKSDFGHTVERLAELRSSDPVEYERERKRQAKRLGIRTSALDSAVDATHPQQQAGRQMAIHPPTWALPEKLSTEPVAGADLLADLISAVRRFMMSDQTDALIVALWILFTWVFEQMAETNPYGN